MAPQDTSTLAPTRSKPLVLNGLYPATVTPFSEDLSVDWSALGAHLRATAEVDGVNGLVVNSGIGELFQLVAHERIEIIELALQVRRPGQIVIAGAAGHSAAEVVAVAAEAKDAGAEALLVFPPFDLRPYRRLAEHPESVAGFFAELDREVGLPVIVFQYPPHSGCAYSLQALELAAEIPSVVGVKAATGTTEAYVELWERLHDKLSVLAAVDSPPLLPMLQHGAHGALIGISAIAPWVWVDLLEAVQADDHERADDIYGRVCLPLMQAVFENQKPTRISSEAGATKEALVQMGQIPSSRVRPLAVDLDDRAKSEIAEAVRLAGLSAGGERTA